MEQGVSLGTYVAYAVIVVFLVVLVLVAARTLFLTSLLLIAPAHEVWTWLSGAIGRKRGTESSDDVYRR